MSRKSFDIDANFQTFGVFWKSDAPNNKFAGTLSAKGGTVELFGTPEYSKIDNELMRQMFAGFNSPPEMDSAPAICGFTTLNRCTLLDPVRLSGDGLANFPTMEAIDRERYRAMRTVLGLHLDSANANSLDSSAYYLSDIQHLFPRPWKSTWLQNEVIYTVGHSALQPFRIDCEFLEATVECQVSVGGGESRDKGLRVTSSPRIKVTPSQLRSLNWFASIAFRLENFFTLILGTSAEIGRVQVFQGNDDGWLIQKVNRKTEKADLQAVARCGHDEIANALKGWLSIPESDRMVELTLLGALRKSELFEETQFLTLAQTLEGFGRIKFGGSRRRDVKMKDLVERTYKLLTVDTAEKLVGDLKSFSQRIIQTRDYYTHLGNRRGSHAVRSMKDLFLLNKRLHAFLRAAILVDLGIPESAISEPAIYQANKWR